MKTKDKISEKFNILVIIPKHPPIPFSCRDFYARDRGTGERLSEGINDGSRSPPVVQYSRRSRIKTSNEHLIEKHGFPLASETDLILYIRPENYTEI